MLKCTPVVDNDATVRGENTDTVAFSPSVLIKCRYLFSSSVTDAHSA